MLGCAVSTGLGTLADGLSVDGAILGASVVSTAVLGVILLGSTVTAELGTTFGSKLSTVVATILGFAEIVKGAPVATMLGPAVGCCVFRP